MREDRILHFIVGAILFIVVIVLTESAWISSAVVVAAALAKEIRDKYAYGGFDWVDLAYTLAGGGLSALGFWLR